MSTCRLCPNATLFENTFCPECEAKFRLAERPAPLTTAPFDIFVWSELTLFKRQLLMRGNTKEQVAAAVYKKAEEMQKQYDIIQRANALERARAVDIAKLADQI